MKPTRVVARNMDLLPLGKKCQPIKKLCQYSGCPHEILSGIRKGDWATAKGSAYPWDFCTKYAKQLVQSKTLC